MRALLLAAGEGRRLRPLTGDRPKAMVALAGRPMIDYSLAWLREQGVTDVAINVHYKPTSLVEHVRDGGAFGVRVQYSPEPRLLGSAGALVPLREFLSAARDFVVHYGDVLTDLDLRQVVRTHRACGAILTVVVTTGEDPTRCGVVEFGDDQRITRFVEKPKASEVFSRWVNAGVYVCSREVLSYLCDPCPIPYDFASDFIPALLEGGAHLTAFPTAARVVDVGSPERLAEAADAVQEGWLASASGLPC